MNDALLRMRLMVFLCLMVGFLVLIFWLYQKETIANSPDGFLTVAFLDVGQGDAIFIKTPDGVQMLIDGGPDSSVLRELAKQMPVGDRSLDVVLSTHADKDHLGGLVDVLDRYEVEQLIVSNNQNDTTVREAFDLAVAKEEVDIQVVSTGYQIGLGASTSLMVFSPLGDTSNWETNTASLVTQLRFGEIEFMLTGDAPISIEEYLAQTYGDTLESEVLKLGHHGSQTSSGEVFLDTVQPKYGIVSAGKDNSYGHPHSEVIEKLLKRNIAILNTADSGTIIFKSDGREVWVE